MFSTALLTIAKLQKQPRCPTTEEWIKKMWYIYTMEFYSAITKTGRYPPAPQSEESLHYCSVHVQFKVI
jgi:hypothetical protein